MSVSAIETTTATTPIYGLATTSDEGIPVGNVLLDPSLTKFWATPLPSCTTCMSTHVGVDVFKLVHFADDYFIGIAVFLFVIGRYLGTLVA